jgi:hypothetical protein
MWLKTDPAFRARETHVREVTAGKPGLGPGRRTAMKRIERERHIPRTSEGNRGGKRSFS